MSTQNIASRRSLRNQTVGIKTWVRATEYHPIQQTAGKICTVPFASGAFRSSSLQPDQSKLTSGRSSSSLARNPRTITKNKASPAAPTPPVPPAGSPGKKTAARIMRTTAEPSPGAEAATAPPNPPWLPTESIRPRPSSRAARLPPPALHHLPWNATVETLSSPSSFDGRGAATAAVAEAGAGAVAGPGPGPRPAAAAAEGQRSGGGCSERGG